MREKCDKMLNISWSNELQKKTDFIGLDNQCDNYT